MITIYELNNKVREIENLYYKLCKPYRELLKKGDKTEEELNLFNQLSEKTAGLLTAKYDLNDKLKKLENKEIEKIESLEEMEKVLLYLVNKDKTEDDEKLDIKEIKRLIRKSMEAPNKIIYYEGDILENYSEFKIWTFDNYVRCDRKGYTYKHDKINYVREIASDIKQLSLNIKELEEHQKHSPYDDYEYEIRVINEFKKFIKFKTIILYKIYNINLLG